MQKYNPHQPYSKENPHPAHGSLTTPASRGWILFGSWPTNGLESGKFFPALIGGLQDPVAPDDIPNAPPPPDGRIASANIPEAFLLDETSAQQNWYKHSVHSGQTLDFTWTYSAIHKTRRHNYFITRSDWNPNAVLARAQFDNNPFVVFENTCQPFWSCELPPPVVVHHLTLPVRSGYHVVLSVWEIADNGNAFYQVIDFNFS